MFEDFRKFVSRGSVIDLAIGVIIGAAFTTIVSSLVDDIFMPLVGVLSGGVNFEELSITVGEASINYGSFIQAVVNFFLVAIILFFITRAIVTFENGLRKDKDEKPPEPEPEPSEEAKLLVEIRDLLKESQG